MSVPLADIAAAGDRRRANCEAIGCGYWADLLPDELIKLGCVTVADVRARLKCTMCGGRDIHMQRLVRDDDYSGILGNGHSEPPS